MKEIRLPKPCSLYYPGHNTHWIAAGQSRSEKDTFAIVTYLGGDKFKVSTDNGDPMLLHHHDPERLTEALATYPEDRFLIAVPGLMLKVLDDEGGLFLFYEPRCLRELYIWILDRLG